MNKIEFELTYLRGLEICDSSWDLLSEDINFEKDIIVSNIEDGDYVVWAFKMESKTTLKFYFSEGTLTFAECMPFIKGSIKTTRPEPPNPRPKVKKPTATPYEELCAVEATKFVSCDACGTKHDMNSDTFYSIHGNICVGMDVKLVGNNFADDGTLKAISIFCRDKDCVIKGDKFKGECLYE